MSEFEILQDPDADDEPGDPLHVFLPSGVSFEDGVAIVESALEADTERHENVVVSVGGEPLATTTRTFLAANFAMTGLMTGRSEPGSSQGQELPGYSTKYTVLRYRCEACGTRFSVVRALRQCPACGGGVAREAG